jgi:DNA modification methylase
MSDAATVLLLERVLAEICFYGWRRGHRPPFYGPRNQDTIWEIGRDADVREFEHATPKPVALWKPSIENHTNAGELIYEPFSGSGSQIIAAEQLERRCFAMEIDPGWVRAAVTRWERATGLKSDRE